jgi:hypothetical protein
MALVLVGRQIDRQIGRLVRWFWFVQVAGIVRVSGRRTYSCKAFRLVGSGSLQTALQGIFRWWESIVSGRL